MTATGYLRGHAIEWVNDHWVYTDDKTPTAGNRRDCAECNQPDTPEGHDACLGTLPSVMNACCGHGHNSLAYVQYEDGSTLHGDKAIWVQEQKKS